MKITWYEIYNTKTKEYITRDSDDNDHSQVPIEFDTYKEAEEYIQYLLDNKSKNLDISIHYFEIKKVECETIDRV